MRVFEKERLKARERPDFTVLIQQKWRDLLFLHWKCEPQIIQETLPKGLFVDTYEGNAYLGIVPFFIEDQRFDTYLKVPGLSSFLEINVRTYVYDKQGRPGVWFYSLDINSFLAAFMGRFYYALPYMSSSIKTITTSDGMIDFSLKRKATAPIHYSFKPLNKPESSPIGSLNFFLIERYRLFSERNTHLYQAQVYHTPYPLAGAQIMHYDDELLVWNSFQKFSRKPDHVIYSPGVNVEIFGPKSL